VKLPQQVLVYPIRSNRRDFEVLLHWPENRVVVLNCLAIIDRDQDGMHSTGLSGQAKKRTSKPGKQGDRTHTQQQGHLR
jgi:hypothetical protein